MNTKTKILIVTDSHILPTGLAETTRLLFGTLLELYPNDYDVCQIGLFHCYAVTEPKWPIYSTALLRDAGGRTSFDPTDRYAQKTFFKLLSKIRPDIVFGFGDPDRVLHLCQEPQKRSYRLVLYLNFDGLPVRPSLGKALNNADLVITMSEFSKEIVRRFLPDVAAEKLSNLYSPADTQRFSAVPKEATSELRTEFFPSWMPRNAFVLGWVGRNQWRKQVWLLYKTIYYLRNGHYLLCTDCGRVTPFNWDPSQKFRDLNSPLALESPPGYRFDICSHCASDRVKEAQPLGDLFLWLHMAEEPEQDWTLSWLEEQFDARAGRDLHYTPGYEHKGALSPTDIPTLYNLWDCLLFLSGGEGFGIPAWEAMCSGLPVIYTNYSAHAEFLNRANAGLAVGGIFQPEAKTCVWRMIADLSQTIEAIRRLYFDRKLCALLGLNGRAFVQDYVPNIIVEKWHRILQGVVSANGKDRHRQVAIR